MSGAADTVTIMARETVTIHKDAYEQQFSCKAAYAADNRIYPVCRHCLYPFIVYDAV